MPNDDYNDTGLVQERFRSENEKAEAYINKSDLRGAAGILVSIIEQDPQNWRAINNAGIVSWMRKAWEDAYQMFERAISIKPDFTDALINFFDACLKLRRIENALPVFEKAMATNPDDDEIRIIYESIRDQGREIYNSQRALAIGFFNPMIDEARRLLDDGKPFEAMEKFLQVNDMDGPNADAFCGLGIISYYQQRYEDAFSLFFESLKINPASTDTFLNLLDAAQACGKTELARQIFDIYLKEFPMLESIAPDFHNA